MVEVPEIVLHEADEPDVLAELSNAEPLTGEHGAQIELAPVGADDNRRYKSPLDAPESGYQVQEYDDLRETH